MPFSLSLRRRLTCIKRACLICWSPASGFTSSAWPPSPWPPPWRATTAWPWPRPPSCWCSSSTSGAAATPGARRSWATSRISPTTWTWPPRTPWSTPPCLWSSSGRRPRKSFGPMTASSRSPGSGITSSTERSPRRPPALTPAGSWRARPSVPARSAWMGGGSWSSATWCAPTTKTPAAIWPPPTGWTSLTSPRSATSFTRPGPCWPSSTWTTTRSCSRGSATM